MTAKEEVVDNEKDAIDRGTGTEATGAVDPLVMQSAISDVLTGMMESGNRELRESSQSDLERYWFFTFDPTRSLEWNLYQFHDLLKLYGSQCRRWEEMHNGCCCVVERVRDKYLMPKIKEFIADTQAHILAGEAEARAVGAFA